MIKWLGLRERTLNYPSISNLNINTGLKSYHLRQILPQIAMEDIFLGFSIDGSFLISYYSDFKHHIVRFWIFPPNKLELNLPKLSLYAEKRFLLISYTSRIQDLPCVRFVQSIDSPGSFSFLACDRDGTGLVTAFGQMPDLDCILCSDASLSISQTNNSYKTCHCPLHSHVLLLNLDLPTSHDITLVEQDNLVNLDDMKSKRYCGDDKNKNVYIPPCLQTNSSNHNTSRIENDYLLECLCHASISSPIGKVQFGTCPCTGSLRIAWACPGSQVKVISCSFTPLESSKQLYNQYVFPKGTQDWFRKSPCLLAYMPPLLTHNYCSSCYSWPERKQCQTKSISTSNQTSQLSNECIFSHGPHRVYLVRDPIMWPDDHHLHCPNLTSEHLVFHKCSKPANWKKVKNIVYPSLLYKRPSLKSCTPVTYLAMIEDIRSSYVRWTLISRPTNVYNHLASENFSSSASLSFHWTSSSHDEEPLPDWNEDNSAHNSTHASSDDELVAIMASPASFDCPISPEDLLAHRLSGQCHTSFDMTNWQEYVECVNEPSGADQSQSFLNSTTIHSNGQVYAHLEEVVFDMPTNNLDENKLPYDQCVPLLSVFIAPNEPDLLLVYAQYSSKMYQSNMRKLKKSNSMAQNELVGIIDLSTGSHLSIPGQNDWETLNYDYYRHHYETNQSNITLSSSQLEKMTKYCPQTLRNQQMFRINRTLNRLHELNNCLMACRQETLKVLVDPQRGYSVYW